MKTTITRQRKGFSSFIDSNGSVNFKLYNTIILSVKDKVMTFNTGGFKTRHTKNCLNDVIPSGFRVFQKDFDWFVDGPTGTIEFVDGLKVSM